MYVGSQSHSIQSDLENASHSISIDLNMHLGNDEIYSCDDKSRTEAKQVHSTAV